MLSADRCCRCDRVVCRPPITFGLWARSRSHPRGTRREIRAILTAALGSGDQRAANLAVDLIHEIGAKGVRDLSDLVRTQRSGDR